MPKVKFDDLEFNSEDLSAEGQAQLKSLQFLQVQIKRLNAEIEICKRAYTPSEYVLAKAENCCRQRPFTLCKLLQGISHF